jgi:UDP-N-acetyl-D-mannosaminuronic acid dehydrogenase
MNPQVFMIVLGYIYIGLPKAALIAQNKTYVHGVDINADFVEIINKGKVHIVKPDLDKAVSDAVSHGFLKSDKIN